MYFKSHYFFSLSLFRFERCDLTRKNHMWWPEQPTPTEIQILLCGFDRKKISGSKKKSLKLGIIQMNTKCGARPIFGP